MYQYNELYRFIIARVYILQLNCEEWSLTEVGSDVLFSFEADCFVFIDWLPQISSLTESV